MRKSAIAIAEILVRRDGVTLDEAKETIREVQALLLADLEEGGDPEETIARELGLEPDYIFDLL